MGVQFPENWRYVTLEWPLTKQTPFSYFRSYNMKMFLSKRYESNSLHSCAIHLYNQYLNIYVLNIGAYLNIIYIIEYVKNIS